MHSKIARQAQNGYKRPLRLKQGARLFREEAQQRARAWFLSNVAHGRRWRMRNFASMFFFFFPIAYPLHAAPALRARYCARAAAPLASTASSILTAPSSRARAHRARLPRPSRAPPYLCSFARLPRAPARTCARAGCGAHLRRAKHGNLEAIAS